MKRGFNHILILWIIIGLFSNCGVKSENQIKLLIYPDSKSGIAYSISVYEDHLVSSRNEWTHDGQNFVLGNKLEEDGLLLSKEQASALEELTSKCHTEETCSNEEGTTITDVWQFCITIGNGEPIMTNNVVLNEDGCKGCKEIVDYLIDLSPIKIYPDYYSDKNQLTQNTQQNASHLDSNFSEKDGIIEIELGLGNVVIQSKVYSVKTIIEKIPIGQNFEERGLLIFENEEGFVWYYESSRIKDLPDEIKDNQFVFYLDEKQDCSEYLKILDDSIYFKCTNSSLKLLH